MATFYELDMNSKKIINCQDPTVSQDVATKNYVDTAKYPIIVSTPVLNPIIINSTLPTNTETVITSVTATIDSSGVYHVFGNLAVQSNANTMNYGSLYCSSQTTPLPTPGPLRNAVVTQLDYNQNFAGIAANLHKQFQGSAIVAGTQLGRAAGSGSGTVTLYLIGSTQVQSGVAQTPDGNGVNPVSLVITRIA
jgi:hypothetical protein